MGAFKLTSSAFMQGGEIPPRHTADRQDVSPPLSWTEPPAGTKSLVLIVDDPDAPMGTWVHWVLCGLQSDLRSLPEGVEKVGAPHGLGGAINGKNDFGKLGYGGPAPPPGPPHRYVFKLSALDTTIVWKPSLTKAEAEKAMRGHVLEQTALMGTYQRR